MFFRIITLICFATLNACAGESRHNGIRVYAWRSDLSTGGKCLSRAFLFEKAHAGKRVNTDTIADFGLGQFPVRKVFVSDSKLDSITDLISDSVGISNASKCSTVQLVAEDSSGNQKKGLIHLGIFLNWISGTDSQSRSEFNELFLLAQKRCCPP